MTKKELKEPHYNATMQNYHNFVGKYNTDKLNPEQIRNGLKHTGEHIIRIWMVCYQGNQTDNYSFITSLKALSSRTAKSQRTLMRHLEKLMDAKIITDKSYCKKGLFNLEINKEIVQFKEIDPQKVINNSP